MREQTARLIDANEVAERGPITADTQGTVYFIQMGADGPIKIGFTSGKVRVRLEALQTGNPYRLRVVWETYATQTRETQLHERFAAYRMQGEWFEAKPIELYLEDIKELRGMPEGPLLSPADVAIQLRVTRRQAVDLMKRLGAIRTGRLVRIDPAKIEAFIAQGGDP